MKHSIRVKMMAILVILVGIVLLSTWILNNTFAEKYYKYMERNEIINCYKEVTGCLEEDSSLLTTNERLEQISNRNNVKMMIAKTAPFSFDQIVIFSNMSDGSKTYGKILQHLQNIRNYVLLHGDELKESETNDSSSLFKDQEEDNLSTLIRERYYVTEVKDRYSGQKGLYLFGFTENDYLIAMRVSIEGIQTSVKINSRFMGYMSLITIVLGILFVFLYSYRFTKPIKEMADMANRMTDLDFQAKVKIHSEDELGELGRSINQLSETLEQTIGNLKAANLELQQDIQKREELDEMRKEFVSHVSHELKTPIAIIQGYAEGLKEGVTDDKESMDFYCEVIVDEAQKMNKMVKNLLTLNQLEFGNTPLNITRFDIQEMIRNKINTSQILLSEKDARIEFEEQGPVDVWADEFMIEEVFSNYLTNAVHYVKDGGLIRIWFEEMESRLRIFVFNEGEQIPEEELDKLWVKFYKVDKARTREYGGNGIGLSIVAATMKAHQREYGVYNTENGVVFYFDLDRIQHQSESPSSTYLK